ncbi:MAG TPA: aminoacyl--tRNA ligase-related protein, partial [Chthoniobacterales bacterium]
MILDEGTHPGSARDPRAVSGDSPEPSQRLGEAAHSEESSAGSPKTARESRALPEPEVRGDRYYLKAMNCPHHHKLFAAVPHSYRDLPLRLAEYGCNYRYEQSGELFGLMRVRSLQMN